MSKRKLRLPVVGETWVDLDIGRSYWVPKTPEDEAKMQQHKTYELTTIRREVTIVAVFPQMGRVSVKSTHSGRVTEVKMDAFHDHDSTDIWDRTPRRGFMRKDHYDGPGDRP